MRPAIVIALVILVFVSTSQIGQAFRSDEVWSLRTAAMPWASMMDEVRSDIHPPLYYVLLKVWTGAFGGGEIGSRSLSLVLHWLAGGAVFAAARLLYGNGAAGLCAVLFIASPLGVLVGQFVRMYALLEFTAAASTWLWLRFELRQETRRRDMALYLVANVAGTFTHVWFLFLLAAQAATHILIFRRRNVVAFFAMLCGSLIPYCAFWLPVLVRQFARTDQALAWLAPPRWWAPIEVVLMQGGVVWLLAPYLIAVATKRRLRLDQPSHALVALWLLAVLGPFALSFLKPVFWARFTVVALPALALAIGGISDRLAPGQVQKPVLALALLFSVGLLAVHNDTCDSRWTAEWLDSRTRRGDVVIFTSLSRLPVDHYWKRRTQVEERSFPVQIDAHPGHEGVVDGRKLLAEAESLVIELAARRAQHGPFSVFLLHGFKPQVDEILRAKLASAFGYESRPAAQCRTSTNYYDTITSYRIP